MRKKYSKYFSQKISQPIHYAILCGAIITSVISMFYYFNNDQPKMYLISFIPSIVLTLLYFLKDRISIATKALVVVAIMIFYTFIYFNYFGFASNGFLVLAAANIFAVLFLNYVFIGFTLLFSIAICLHFIVSVRLKIIHFDKAIGHRLNSDFAWLIQSLTFLAIISGILIILIAIKKFIYEILNDLEGQMDHIETQAYTDPLTKLLNRNGFINAMEQMISPETKGTFILFDIVDFKSINTMYGTDTGDRVLSTIGQILTQNHSSHTAIARFGSNEFAIYTQETANARIYDFFKTSNKQLNEKLPISHGLAWHLVFVKCPDHGPNFDICYKNATIALKLIKEDKTLDYITFKPSMRQTFEKETLIKDHFKRAFVNHEFYSLFQKKINAKTNALIGVEALARWESENLGFIPPDVFIPLLTKSNMMHQFSKHMIVQTMTDFNNASHLPDHIKLSINISPAFVASHDFTDIILEAISSSKLASDRLILEITEDVMVYDLKDLQEKVKTLKTHGIRFSLDDFGTGFSSLKYLTAIAFDEIKIDKTFINNILSRPEDYALLKSIIALTNVLDYTVVAEGVETKDQLDAVLDAGCHIIQGYYYAKPERLENIHP